VVGPGAFVSVLASAVDGADSLPVEVETDGGVTEPSRGPVQPDAAARTSIPMSQGRELTLRVIVVKVRPRQGSRGRKFRERVGLKV
jgi:hypothetical protein